MTKMPTHAFILAAGKGTRLRPYTDTMPKPMVPVNGTPILEHTLHKLKNDNVNNIIINTNYLGDRIKNYIDTYQALNITISEEDQLLDTGGGVKYALDQLGDQPFFMINGDAFWEEGQQSVFERLSQQWDPETMDILILLQPVNNMVLTQGIGDYDLDANGHAIRSKDKTGQYMFAGVRITKPELFKNKEEDVFSFLELMDEAQTKNRLYGLVHDGDWHHISTPQDLDNVNAALQTKTKEAKTA